MPLYIVFHFHYHNSLSAWTSSTTFAERLTERLLAESEGTRGKIQGYSAFPKM